VPTGKETVVGVVVVVSTDATSKTKGLLQLTFSATTSVSVTNVGAAGSVQDPLPSPFLEHAIAPHVPRTLGDDGRVALAVYGVGTPFWVTVVLNV
jgi:hypothetical protein